MPTLVVGSVHAPIICLIGQVVNRKLYKTALTEHELIVRYIL